MNGPVDRLIELASACLVRLACGGVGGGSGVWMAPGLVLTCAHVVPLGPRSEVTVEWQGKCFTGIVTAHAPNPAGANVWPYPDLAIVEVANFPQHPCAWVSERRPAHNADLMALGHSGKLGEGLRQHTAGARLAGDHEFGSGAYWQVKDNEFVAGMSGGPVLELATGAVCALVTTTLGEDADRGGYIVPLTGLAALSGDASRSLLAAHDHFHAADDRWTRLRAELPAPPIYARLPLRPAEEVELLGHLAALPDPEPSVLSSLAGGDAPPETLREAVYQVLDECCFDEAGIDGLFQLTCRLTGATPATGRRGLYDWATALAGRTDRRTQLDKMRHHSSAPTPAPRGVISVEIAPATSRVGRYRLTVSVEDERRKRRLLHMDPEPTRGLADVREVARGRLRAALESLEGNALIEFVVPIELFDEPFEELSPINPHTNIGRQHRVVLRDYDRQRHRAGRHAWQQRWRHLQGPASEIRWLSCTEETDPSDLWSELDQSPQAAVLALTRRPSSNQETTELLRNALEAGIPAVVWRRDTCAEHDKGTAESDCSGDTFRSAIDAVLRAEPIADLPERVRQLRSRAASTKAIDRDRRCRQAVLIWDDPGRAAAGTLSEPPYQAQEN